MALGRVVVTVLAVDGVAVRFVDDVVVRVEVVLVGLEEEPVLRAGAVAEFLVGVVAVVLVGVVAVVLV